MKNKGITLIALVITIIVLLILAGVSITAIIGEDGIITKAKIAKEETEKAADKENIELAVAEYKLEESSSTLEEFLESKEWCKDVTLNEETQMLKITMTNGKTYEIENIQGIDSGNEDDTGINWNEIKADVVANYDEYLAKAQEKGQTKVDIGIGTDGEIVNLDLWNYFFTDDGTGISLGKGEGCGATSGYKTEILNVEGKIQGKMPQYIYIESENKIYPVTVLESTFSSSAANGSAFDTVSDFPEIPTTVKNISCAFDGCTGLTSITIPSSVTSIGRSAFSGCTSLTSVTIPSSVTNIGSSAFSFCEGLTSITIPSNVTSIGENAFWYCEGLTSITISSSVTSIGDEAFGRCESLTSVTIPSSVTSIGENAFCYCEGLASITIPSSVTSIGENAFTGCTSLTSIDVDEANTKYDSRDNCNAIIETATNILIIGCNNTTIPSNVTSIGENAFWYCEGLTSITIPSSVTSIGDEAFGHCEGLTSVTIPSSVTSIGENAFCYCRGLTSIDVDEANTKYDSRDNCNAIIETATNTLILGCNNTIIPSSVTSIGEYAFAGCTSLTSIVIPSSVTSIGEYAFYGCTALDTVYFNQTTKPIFGSICFKKFSGVKTTFYFKNSTVASAFTTSHYNASYGTKSTDYSW